MLSLDVLSSSSSSDDEDLYAEISNTMKENVPTVLNFISTVVYSFTDKQVWTFLFNLNIVLAMSRILYSLEFELPTYFN